MLRKTNIEEGMKNVDYYTIACVQSNAKTIKNSEKIKNEVLPRIQENINWVMGFHGSQSDRFPVKLVVFPENFLQGWLRPSDYENSDPLEAAKNYAISIPGDETDILAEKAREYNTYIAGTAMENDPDWPEIVWNTGWVMNPDGEIVLKYRKLVTNYMPGPSEVRVSPHDVYERYKEIHGKHGYDNPFFPVVDTEIGKLGMLICADGLIPENWRPYAMQGCDVLIRPNGINEPGGLGWLGTPKLFKAENRVNAAHGAMYVASTNFGSIDSRETEQCYPGHAMIVNHNGVVLAEGQQGEMIVSGQIDLEHLRKRRKDVRSTQTVLQLRTELYRDFYEKELFPPDKGPIDYEEGYQYMRKVGKLLYGYEDFNEE